MARAAVWLIVFNLVDAVATSRGLAVGLLKEANPFLAWLIRDCPAGAWLLKLGMVPLLALWLGGAARPRWASHALFILALAYGCVVALHLAGYLASLA
ncbi:MAG: DUF5658 family protein [Chitinophagales bacterium]